VFDWRLIFYVFYFISSKIELNTDDDNYEFRFAKHRKGWFNRTFRTGEIHDDAQLLTYKKSLIKKALLKQNRDLDAEAVQVFKSEELDINQSHCMTGSVCRPLACLILCVPL
jgi:hypothetical protein